MELLRFIGNWIGTFFMLGYSIALLMVMIITLVYGGGYLYDSCFGDSLYKVGVKIAKKLPGIRKNRLLRSIN